MSRARDLSDDVQAELSSATLSLVSVFRGRSELQSRFRAGNRAALEEVCWAAGAVAARARAGRRRSPARSASLGRHAKQAGRALGIVVILATTPGAATPVPVASLIAQLDALHGRRDDPAALAEAHRVADAALAVAATDHAVLWRAARERFTESDVPTLPKNARVRLGQEAYEIALRAIVVNPNHVAGHYWAALSIGSAAEGMGVLRALANGVEGKFKRPLERATALDERYDHGSIPVIWAAYYLELPWPKRDRAQAARQLKRALEINPASLRARLYQARIAIDEDRPAEARTLLAAIASAPVGRYDPPEERRVKTEAAAMGKMLH